MKDNFSKQADLYAKFRPQYPDELLDYVVAFVENKKTALDIATGNGQVAQQLSKRFEKVNATDISEEQLEKALKANNIVYSKGSAEDTGFADDSFDLVVVAQAVHWFDFDKFYKEVSRILKRDGILAVIGYGLFSTNPDSDKIIHNFYYNIIGSYWDPERKYLDDNYETIPFPLDEIPTRKFDNPLHWDFDHLAGYLETWSAVQHYRDKNNSNPVDIIREELRKSWQKSDKKVTFPLLLRIGKNVKS